MLAMFFLFVVQFVFLPGFRHEVEVIAILWLPPDKTNAGGAVEGHEAFNDDVSLAGGCREQWEKLLL